MRSVGIICEYNPFHTGHAWQLGELRRRLGEDTAVVCVMSGNYVQRGDLAIVRKHVRAEAAVRGGANLVIELPLPWASASAEGFARAGVELLEGTGIVDSLAFGSECADTCRLVRTAEALCAESFPTLLREELKAGDSFAHARERAARALCGSDADCLGSPNDILGVEYCKALRQTGSGIEPLALERIGALHDGEAAGGYASASELRQKLCEGEDVTQYLTPDMYRLYKAEALNGKAPVRMETAERAILSRLRTMSEDELAAYDDGGEGLYHRFYDAARSAAGLTELLEAVKTKRYAYARLRRMLLSAYLGITPELRTGHVPYIRVLAMNGRGKALLKRMRESASLPVLIKPAYGRKLSRSAQSLMELEARATDLYALAYPDLSRSAGGSEWKTDPVIIEEDAE
ncbi:MAG: nucleotidyltransferase family protein [Oscillospiraceae bacterium]|nr:nucleotidyltransferase family protein [Oscillospiraceae bacterium]